LKQLFSGLNAEISPFFMNVLCSCPFGIVKKMALKVGYIYPNLQKFLADIERHEEESNGAFEVQTNETSD
jgi:hypothetical protein